MDNPVYYNEIDKSRTILLRNLMVLGIIPKGDIDTRSIEDVEPDELIQYKQCHFFAGIGGWAYALQVGGFPDTMSIWTGSCPCQPFSGAGRREGDSDRRHLWPSFFNLIDQCRPAVCVGEQVSGRDGIEWFSAVRLDLESIGYACGAADIAASSIGARHQRRRLFWGASNPLCERLPRLEPNKSVSGAEKEAFSIVGDATIRGGVELEDCVSSVLSLDGVSLVLDKSCIFGFGDAIVPQVGAIFTRALIKSISHTERHYE